jgi:ABC-2 type transport system ATP-binding protein
LTHRFGALVAVDRLDLEVPLGSIFGFLGPNGAGKTTTIRALLGLIRPTAGEVRLFGQPLARQRRALLRRVGALVETPSLYPHLTGRENLDIKRALIGEPRSEVDRVLDIVGLQRAASRLVRGYSLGMQQRLGLVKALLGRPDLLILDEPTNGLDPTGMREFRELLRGLPTEQGVSVFLSSHLLGEVEQVATHVGIIGRGRVLFQGTLAELHGLTGGHLVVEVDHAEAAADVLRRAGWRVEQGSGGHLAVDVGASSDAAAVNAALVRAGVRVYQLRIEQPALEQFFLRLTARAELVEQAVA